jgi:hypothetical protein
MDSQPHPPGHRPSSSIEAEVRDLRQQVRELSARMLAVELGLSRPAPSEHQQASSAPVGGAAGGWLGHSAALRRIATISFVLVIALVLRTLTDGGIVGQTLGVRLGIGYAVMLMGVGWHHMARNRPGKRVFAVCGALLLCALVLETHTHFEYLSAVEAHVLLLGTLLASTWLGLRYRLPVVVEAGVFAAGATSLAIGFPVPNFNITAANLLLALLAGTAVAWQRKVAWLHWVVLALLSFFWLLWSVKLHIPLSRGSLVPPELQLAWYVPALVLTFAVLLGLSCLRSSAEHRVFALFLPVWNVVWALGAAAAVLPWMLNQRWIGAVALVVAGLQFALAHSDRKLVGGHSRSAIMSLAAVVAFLPGLWLFAGSLLFTLVGWALLALALARWSHHLGSTGLRLSAGLLQVGTTVAAAALGVFAVPPTVAWQPVTLGLLLAVIAGLHYRWACRTAIPEGSWYARLAPTDRPSVTLLWASVAASYGSLRVAVYPLLAMMPVEIDNTFAGAQSVILNGLAILLLITARATGSRPLLNTAAIVSAIGGLKVFAVDFLQLHGIPLVLSVFSFGVTAAVGSMILGRWPRATTEPPGPNA